MWRHGLPDNWPETYLPSIQAVTLDQAQKALEARWDTSKEIWLIVGDKAAVEADIKAFGLPVVELNSDGERIGG
ncbi:MAG: hypothetical protein AB8H79_17215 [Myxococcota bacterium]